jgi:outer membrane protein OmpA-like peptidoglycan-associated protein
MKKSLIRSSLIVFSLFAACSQSEKLVKKADKAFKVKGEYQTAIEAYQKALEKGAPKAYVNAQIAESYRLSNRLAEAAPFYKEAVAAGAKADSILFQLPFALKAAGNYAEAKAAFNDYIANGGKPARVERAQRELINLEKIEEIKSKRTWYELQNVDDINTVSADFSPFIFNDQLLFTSGRNGKVYGGDGTSFTNIYKYKIGSVGPESVTPFVDKFNTQGRHEASITISKDGKMAVFARSNDGKRKSHKEVCLYMSRFSNNEWSEPELMSINDLDAWNGSPAFSADGKTLYFSSNRRGGKGGLDLYRATIDANGKWGKVTNMGDIINTPGDEIFPYATEDGKLYFSSDGHPSLGGLDIFVATKDKEAGIVVENMGVPINSTADDFGIVFLNPIEGYLSSNRSGGKGSDDIYKFKDTKNELRIVKFNLKGTVFGKDEAMNKIEPLANQTVKLLDVSGNVVAETVSDEQGKFTFPMAASSNYTIYASKDGYLTERKEFSTVGKSPSQDQLTEKETTIDLDFSLTLEKLKIDKVFVIENIYYDLDKFDIRPDAAIELDKIVTILNDNPKISIELSAHTDSRGNDDYNLSLSQKRADAAKQYMVSKGISASRITAKGYGETKPIIENANTEEEHEKNRRTEFKIIKIQQ